MRGWAGPADDHRNAVDVESSVRQRRVEIDGLRRALRVARREKDLAPRAANPDLRRVAVEAQHALLRHALRAGDLDLIRRAGRAFRVADFAADPAAVECLLGVMRDARSASDESFDAAAQIAALTLA